MTRVLFVVPCSPYFPSGIVRVDQYLDRLRADGIDARVLTYFSPAVERAKQRRSAHGVWAGLAKAPLSLWSVLYITWARLRIAASVFVVDAVVVHWVLLPRWLSCWVAWRTSRLVYDFDDAVFLSAPPRARTLVTRAWRVVAGSHMLLDYARSLNPGATLFVPSAVPLESYVGGATPAPRAVACIGWIGSFGTLPQLERIAQPLRQLAAEGLDFELLIAGTNGRRDLFPDLSGVAVREIETYSASELPGLVARLDVGVMPLEDTEWNRGKCAMKALIYMAGGKPVVLSPVGENRYAVQDGDAGFFADTPDEWHDRLHQLLTDSALRAEQGRRGRAVIEARYSTAVCYRELWRAVFSQI